MPEMLILARLVFCWHFRAPRRLNFFQHHGYIHAPVPRAKCPEHGVKRVQVPWARPGSAFTPLLEQAVMTLVRVVHHYVAKAIARFDPGEKNFLAIEDGVRESTESWQEVLLNLKGRGLRRVRR